MARHIEPTILEEDRSPAEAGEVTVWLKRWGYGDATAINEILPEVYQELRHIGQRILARERSDHTLSTTALVHEAYLKLEGRDWEWENRAHFFAAAAEAIRRVLLEHARARKAI